jgi:hypothetical protein
MGMNNEPPICDELRALMADKYGFRVRLAARAGISPQTWSNIVAGQGASIGTWDRIARAFGLQITAEPLTPDPHPQACHAA